jgi:hypothetical protein
MPYGKVWRKSRRYAPKPRYQYGAKPLPAPTPAGPRACSRRQEGDEYVCHCGLRWGVDDPRPPCPHLGSY